MQVPTIAPAVEAEEGITVAVSGLRWHCYCAQAALHVASRATDDAFHVSRPSRKVRVRPMNSREKKSAWRPLPQYNAITQLNADGAPGRTLACQSASAAMSPSSKVRARVLFSRIQS